jgi:hypothetical protein
MAKSTIQERSTMTDRAPDTDAGGETDDRYAMLEIGDEDIVIYDREESSAWLQSDHTVEPAA